MTQATLLAPTSSTRSPARSTSRSSSCSRKTTSTRWTAPRREDSASLPSRVATMRRRRSPCASTSSPSVWRSRVSSRRLSRGPSWLAATRARPWQWGRWAARWPTRHRPSTLPGRPCTMWTTACMPRSTACFMTTASSSRSCLATSVRAVGSSSSRAFGDRPVTVMPDNWAVFWQGGW